MAVVVLLGVLRRGTLGSRRNELDFTALLRTHEIQAKN
jgi:hypothetical protein